MNARLVIIPLAMLMLMPAASAGFLAEQQDNVRDAAPHDARPLVDAGYGAVAEGYRQTARFHEDTRDVRSPEGAWGWVFRTLCPSGSATGGFAQSVCQSAYGDPGHGEARLCRSGAVPSVLRFAFVGTGGCDRDASRSPSEVQGPDTQDAFSRASAAHATGWTVACDGVLASPVLCQGVDRDIRIEERAPCQFNADTEWACAAANLRARATSEMKSLESAHPPSEDDTMDALRPRGQA